jgi:hypothetical protein
MLGASSRLPRSNAQARQFSSKPLAVCIYYQKISPVSLSLRRLGLQQQNPDVVIKAASITGNALPDDENELSNDFDIDEGDEFVEEGGEEFEETEFSEEGADDVKEPTPEMIAGLNGNSDCYECMKLIPREESCTSAPLLNSLT